MKNTVLTILLALIAFIGVALALMQMYASTDSTSRPLYGSMEYFATSVFIFSFLYNLDENTSIILKWINIMLSSAFAGWGLILALICLYASPTQQSEPLASVLFLSSMMIASSGIFFLMSKIRVANTTTFQ